MIILFGELAAGLTSVHTWLVSSFGSRIAMHSSAKRVTSISSTSIQQTATDQRCMRCWVNWFDDISRRSLCVAIPHSCFTFTKKKQQTKNFTLSDDDSASYKVNKLWALVLIELIAKI